MIKCCNNTLKKLIKEQGFIIEPTNFHQVEHYFKMFMNEIRPDIKHISDGNPDLAFLNKLHDELKLASKWYNDRIRHRTNKDTFKRYLNHRYSILTM